MESSHVGCNDETGFCQSLGPALGGARDDGTAQRRGRGAAHLAAHLGELGAGDGGTVMQQGLKGMHRLLRVVMLAVVVAVAGSSLAQTPMSPLYPTTIRNAPQPGASEKITSVPATPNTTAAPKPEPAPTPPIAATTSPGDVPVAAADIPPPPAAAPSASARPQRPATVQFPPNNAVTPAPKAKRQPRAAQARRYARRSYARWYYGYAPGSWGGGQYGPAPYSASGP